MESRAQCRQAHTAVRLRHFLAAALVVAGAAMHTHDAHAAGTQFALTCIGTETGGAINFQYRWGPSGEWRSASVQPGRWQAITYRYGYEGENRAPQLEIRYDDDMSSAANFVRTRVQSYAARAMNCEAEGYTYNFVNRSGELFLRPEDALRSVGTRL